MSFLQPPELALVLALGEARPALDLGQPVYQATGYQGSARFQIYRSEPPRQPEPAIAEGRYISLLDYQVVGTTLNLRWRVKAAPPPPASLFVHLDAPDGSLAAAYDALRVPVEYWQAGDVIWHRYTLEPLPPPGDYQLVVGLYALEEGGVRYTTIPLTTLRVP